MFGIGHTLLEEMIYIDGNLVNPNLVDYHLPGFNDMPGDFKTILLENRNGPGPYGSKGMGEGGQIAAPAAVANAVADALVPFGARVTRLPLTPDNVLGMIGKIGAP